MQNRPKTQQFRLTKPTIQQTNKQVPSLTKLAFSKFAESKQGLFTPNSPERFILDAIRRSNSDLAANIKTLPEVLGHYSAWGMQEEAQALLAKLSAAQLNIALTTPVTIKDYAKRRHSGTAFELALKMGDVTHDDNFECMAEMLVRHMRNLENGQAIIDAQFNRVFGDDFDAHLAKQQQNVYLLDAVVTAINDATEEQLQAQLKHEDNSSTLNQTISVYREQFNKHSSQEEVFNPYHSLEALKDYDKQFVDWDWPKRDLFWRQIIGYMQRYWPRCWLQAVTTGLWVIADKPRSNLGRGVDVKNHVTDKMISLDSLDDDPNSRLGFDFAIYIGLGGSAVERERWPWGVWRGCLATQLQNLCRAKIRAYKTYIRAYKTYTAAPRTEELSYCNVM